MRYNHKFDSSEEIQEIKLRVRAWIGKAQYKIAYKYLLKEQKRYPQSYYIASVLATLNAEDAFVLSDHKRRIIFKKAASKLKELLKYARSCDDNLRSRNRNEYYWFSEQHKKQYFFGKKLVKSGENKGYYSSGVGAANLAYKLAKAGKEQESHKWALKSIEAWNMYFKLVSTDYHDPWYWYSLALAANKDMKSSQKAMLKSAKLSGLDIKKDPAFKKLNKMIKEMERKTK